MDKEIKIKILKTISDLILVFKAKKQEVEDEFQNNNDSTSIFFDAGELPEESKADYKYRSKIEQLLLLENHLNNWKGIVLHNIEKDEIPNQQKYYQNILKDSNEFLKQIKTI